MGKLNANGESRNQNFLTPPWKQFIFDVRWKQYVSKWAKSLTSNSDVTSKRKIKTNRRGERAQVDESMNVGFEKREL